MTSRLAAWALENGCVVGLCLLRHRLLPSLLQARTSFWRCFRTALGGSLIIIEGSILAQRLLVAGVYAHLPYFDRPSSSEVSSARKLADWLRCNLIIHLFGSAFIAAQVCFGLGPGTIQKLLRNERRPFSVPGFLGKLLVVRLVADVVFYLVHRALHSRLLYRRLHQRHHEHKHPRLDTNFHFTVTDLLLEGFVPMMTGLQLVNACRIPISQIETSLTVAYMEWYEIGTHSGKNVPTVSYFPPLAPVYNTLLGDVDANNILFHHRHHCNSRNKNFGITQWMDLACGTADTSSQVRSPTPGVVVGTEYYRLRDS